jgi:hypothetical protein
MDNKKKGLNELHKDENKKVVLERAEQKKEVKGEEEEEEARHRHGKMADCGCKYF